MSQSSHFSSAHGSINRNNSTSKVAEHTSDRMGLLSLTLAPSPAIRWILPARIRNSRSNDVVFVGNTFIQLRQFYTQGRLRLSEAIGRLDLDTQILGAKVISAKVEVIPAVDAILDQEYDEVRYMIGGKRCPHDHPPQILVITTTSNELVYVYARDLNDGKNIAFIYAKKTLPRNVINSERYSRHIAIDPDCKIMAVGSHSTITVFSVKEVDQLKSSIDAWRPDISSSFQPNREQRMIQVDGHILKMEFLQPAEKEPDKAILVLVVVKGGQSYLLIYKWDVREPLDQMQPENEPPQLLTTEDSFPLLLIPSRSCASFILMTEDSYVFVGDTKYASCVRNPFPTHEFPQSSIRSELLVTWGKPWRHDNYNNATEDILFMREDGLLIATQRNMNTNMVARYQPATFKINIDTAMCMLPGPRGHGGDVLVVAGSMGNGGVYHLPARREVKTLQTIPNASPINGVILVNSSNNEKQDSRACRTFAIAGQPNFTTPNELRFGFEAQMGWNIPHPDANPVTRMWILEQPTSETLLILTSHLQHTSAISFDLKEEKFSDVDLSVYCGLQLDEPTFAAGMLLADVSVQITSRYIAIGIETESPILSPIDECMCATIDTIENTFAIACRSMTGHTFQIGSIFKSDNDRSIVFSPPCHVSNLRPLCLELFLLFDKRYLCVGYLDGSVEVFSIDSEGAMTSKTRLTSEGDDKSAVTTIVALCYAEIPHMILLAGTRDGKVKVLKLSFTVEHDTISVDCEVDRVYQMDVTPVAVSHVGSTTDKSSRSALIQSESRLDQITCFRNAAGVDYMLNHVWLTNRGNPMFNPPLFTAAHSVRNLKLIRTDTPKNILMCTGGGEIIFAEMIEQEHILRRQIGLISPGAQMTVYSKYLNKIIVVSNPNRGRLVGDENFVDDKDYVAPVKYPTLSVIDPDRAPYEAESDNTMALGEQDERVTVMIPWEPSDGYVHRSLFVIGLNGELQSRLGCVAQKKLSSNPGSTVLKTIMTFGKKTIYAVCSMELSSLVVSVDLDIIVLKYDFQYKRWHEECRYKLVSPARSLSSQGSFIYAATESHSVVILQWIKGSRQITPILQDRIVRNARMVIPFGRNGDHVLYTVASAQGTCIGASSVFQKNDRKELTPLFEADMPLGVEHIAQIPTSWTQSTQYAFQGIAFDGTVYVFQTLTHSEWKLLRFLEQLVQPDPAKSTKKKMSLMSKKTSKKFLRAAKEKKINLHMPKKMHVQGDILKRLVDLGPSNLRSLLGRRVKREEDEMSVDGDNDLLMKLETLAIPVIGQTTDLPDAVIIWTRKMLRATVF